MAFCPFFVYRDCPANGECALYNSFGCEMVEKAGKPATFTDTSPPQDPVDVLIMEIFSGNAKPAGDILIIYALASDGSIHLEDDITKFTMHIL